MTMTSFGERQRTLFESLRAAEESSGTKKGRSLRQTVGCPQNPRQLRSQMKQFRGKRSIFTRPEDTIAQCLGVRKVPDYQINPGKWTHYSLEDVPDVTDRSNAKAAAICLQEIQASKQVDVESANDDGMQVDDSKVVFKLPVRISSKSETRNKSNVVYRNSKILLPEYVVGKRERNKATKLEKQTVAVQNKNELKLDHLLDDDDDS
ncbi:uncharacterized protein LOC143913568 [Arctopsyche grandis]|uniref:uncharacterized protein LOC143913568 n=1 Tax=Arctopsyche grandis TaxID=121162 RepID=UPI00406D7CE4